jgi:hypothetical protein
MNGTSVISPVSNTLNQLFSQIVESIPKVISAAIILLIGYIIGRVVGWAIKKVLEKMNFEKTIQKTTLGETVSRSGWSMTKIISTAASWFIYLFFIVAAPIYTIIRSIIKHMVMDTKPYCIHNHTSNRFHYC